MPNEDQKFNFVPFENEFKVDVAESDIQTVTESTDLSEDSAEALATIVESKVNSTVSEISEKVESHYRDQAETMLEEKSQELVGHISGFLETALNEWFEEKLETIDESLKAEINSDLVEGLVGLLKESYFEIPADRKDLVESLSSDLEDSEEEVNRLEGLVEKLELAAKGKQCEDIVTGLSEGLADTQAEKFVSLIEDFDIDNVETFEKKAKIIRESLFGKLDESADDSNTDDDEKNLDESKKDKNDDPQLSYADQVLQKSRTI